MLHANSICLASFHSRSASLISPAESQWHVSIQLVTADWVNRARRFSRVGWPTAKPAPTPHAPPSKIRPQRAGNQVGRQKVFTITYIHRHHLMSLFFAMRVRRQRLERKCMEDSRLHDPSQLFLRRAEWTITSSEIAGRFSGCPLRGVVNRTSLAKLSTAFGLIDQVGIAWISPGRSVEDPSQTLVSRTIKENSFCASQNAIRRSVRLSYGMVAARCWSLAHESEPIDLV